MTALPLHSFAGQSSRLAETARGAGSLTHPLRAPGSRRADAQQARNKRWRTYDEPTHRQATAFAVTLGIATSMYAIAGTVLLSARDPMLIARAPAYLWFAVGFAVLFLINEPRRAWHTYLLAQIQNKADAELERAVAAALSDHSPREMGRAA